MAHHQFQFQPFIKLGANNISPAFDAQNTTCADFEMRMADCLEAYGLERGMKKCEDFISDLKECMFNSKQRQRVQLMRAEHVRQYKNGERKEMFSKTPAYDAF